jgi:hypothetical protein
VSGLPFFHLNLRRNPFGELTAAERTRLAIVECDAALQHLKSPRSVIQVVGERGYGKTTHLLALAAQFAENAYVHIPEGQRAAIPAQGEPLLIDEAQRMTLMQQWTTFRSQRRLVLGTHSDFEPALRRAGRQVLTIAADQFTDATRVQNLLNARIEFARRDAGPIPKISQATASLLFKQYGSDIRSIEHSMYLTFQQLRSVQDV